MKFHIITIFPESFTSFLKESIIWRAKKQKLFQVFLYDLWYFSEDRFHRVDDKAYGMHGQVLCPEPLSKAIESIFKKCKKKIPVIYFTPKGKVLTQKHVEKYAQKFEEIIIICWHYEGIDQRIIDMYVDYEISIWKYVLSGGELAAQVFMDTIIRHIPGVLWNSESLAEESFSLKLSRKKEYPVYTRPSEFLWKKVPEILLSGNHKKIEEWKKNNLL